jgi:HK97 gp10 family phage protein
MRKFKSDLSYDGLGNLIDELKKYKDSLGDKCNDIVRELMSIGVDNAKVLCPVDTGEARDSITGYVDESSRTATIIAGSHCIYIEFGTGVVGAGSSHPSAEWIAFMSWAYGSGGTIFTTKDGRTGWYYPADDGTWKFTEGMPSRPFMYETVQYLKRQCSRVAKEAFKK